MAVINVEDIVGIYEKLPNGQFGRLYCIDCWEKESPSNKSDYDLDQVVTRKMVEDAEGDREYFCDICKKRL